MKRLSALLLMTVLAGAAPALAHHSVAMFDQSRLMVLRGVVKSFSFVNPHSWISIVGSSDGAGEQVRWDVEATSPSTLARLGLTADALKPGDRVTVAIRPLLDGRHGGSMVFVIGPDGKRYGADPQALGLSLQQLTPEGPAR
jgi:hypothetical protein